MATDAEIQKFVQRHRGFIPKTGWIAHVKEVHGIPTLRGANRARRDRDIEPCPPEKREAIEEALRHFERDLMRGRRLLQKLGPFAPRK